MIACNARHRLTVCVSQGKLWLVMPDIVRPSVLPKGHDGIPRSTSSDCVCCPREIMACHTPRRLNVCATQGTCGHAKTDVVQPYVQSKGDDGMPRLTLSDRVCFPREMIACNDRRRLIVCVA